MKHYRFSQLNPIMYYDKVLGNFIHNIDIQSLNNIEMIEYQIKDYDTPENICYRLYGDSSLSWILFYFNSIIDPFFDWPLNTNELRKYCINKYGENNLDTVHHWVLNGKVVNKSKDATSITNMEYEINLNDAKRKIQIPTPEVITLFLNNLVILDE
jgi:hypothetical protein